MSDSWSGDWAEVDWTQKLLQYSPKKSRKMWIVINSVFLTSSILLLVEIFLTLEPKDRLEGTRAYLTYNTIVCFAWTIESGLHFMQYWHECFECNKRALDISSTTTADRIRSNEKCAIIIELVFAVYFTFDAITALSKWQQPSEVVTQIFDVMVDAAAYAYLLTRLVYFTQDEDDDDDRNETEQEEEVTPYIGSEMA